jgi:cell division inhibitor SulA
MGASMAMPVVQPVGAAAAAIAREPVGSAEATAAAAAPTGGSASLDTLLSRQTVWRAGRAPLAPARGEPTGFDVFDALLPQGGWPCAALTELLLPCDGIGELSLLLPTLARLTRAGARVVLVAPPYVPYAPAWRAAGVELSYLHVVEADPRGALWAFEQCLRSGACAAVLGWPLHADARALRRLQVAAGSGDCLGFAFRDRRHAANPSPAALRIEHVPDEAAWRVRKCRGSHPPMQAFVPVGAAGAAIACQPGDSGPVGSMKTVATGLAASGSAFGPASSFALRAVVAPAVETIESASTIAAAAATVFVRHAAPSSSTEGNCRSADALAG